jgi:hypothetical protein
VDLYILVSQVLLLHSPMMVMMIHNHQQSTVLLLLIENLYLFLYVLLNDIEVLVLSYIVLDKIRRGMVVQPMYIVDDDYQ